MTKNFLMLILTLALLGGSAQQVAAEWKSVGSLKLPPIPYNFVAATPNGDLVVTTFNSAPSGDPPKEMPALLLTNVMSGTPTVKELGRVPFDPQRGYSGVACKANGDFFLTGDTGERATCFIRKFKPDGTPDPAFGQGGIVIPNRRTLGLDVFDDYLLVALDWGEIGVFDANTGRPMGTFGKGPKPLFVRDIAVDPKSMRIFGVVQGGIVTWGGGTPWNPAGYAFRELVPQSTDPRSGEGISIDPVKRSALVTPVPGNLLKELHGNGRVDTYTVATAAVDTHLADSVLSFDGTTLFISDMRGRTIHVMQRDVAEVLETRQVAQGRVTATGAASQNKVEWSRAYDREVIETARSNGQPIIVYFRHNNFPGCAEFEKDVLLTERFNDAARGFICVFEDVALNRLLAYRFGVLRVPSVVVLDKEGNTVAEYSGVIDPEKLFASIK